MSNTNTGIVVIYDKVQNRQGIDIFSNNLEFTSPIFSTSLEEAFSQITNRLFFYESPSEFMDNIKLHKNDIIFPTIWSGVDSRNRKLILPAICEGYNLKYIGADAFAHAICADKSLSKKFCSYFNILSPNEIVINYDYPYYDSLSILKFPAVVKPNYEGSSIGISDNNIVNNLKDADLLIKKLQKKYTNLLIEEYIEGKEISACIVGNNKNIKLFEIVKLILDGNDYFKNKIWGYESKKGGNAVVTREIVTDIIDIELKNLFIDLFNSLGKVDFMRIDGRMKKVC